MTETRYLVAGDHGSILANGTPVSPGDELPAASVDPENEHDQHLIADGFLIDRKPSKEGSK